MWGAVIGDIAWPRFEGSECGPKDCATLAKLREDVEAHGLAPCLLGAHAPPGRALQGQDGFERFLERRRHDAGLSANVSTGTRDTTIVERSFPHID